MSSATRQLIVGSFPYHPGFNPYQKLFTQALEDAGIEVRRIPPTKYFPLSRACRHPLDILHLDWHYDWYRGKNLWTRISKSVMYRHGLRSCRRLPVIWTAHNLTSHDSPNPQRDRDCTQQLINVCQGIVVMSAASESLLRSEYSVPVTTRVQQIHHGHYIDCYPNEISRDDARTKLGIAADEFVYLTIGSLRPYKGHLELIRAFASVALPTDRLVIAGSASDESYLVELQNCIDEAKSDHPQLRIDLHARTIVDDEMQVFFKAANVCVLPFRRILNSGSLLLAMSFGKPVVAPSIGSIPEIAHSSSYIAYDIANESGLCEALHVARETCTDSTAEESILEFTREKYCWSHVGHRLHDLYHAILDKACE